LQERQKKIDAVRQTLAESIAQEKEMIQGQASTARTSLEAESGRIAREIGARVLNRPIAES